jgi:hypothetical protein
VTVACPAAGMHLTLRQDRLDRLAGALGVRRVRPGGTVPALWHWTSIAPACAIGTSVRVRLFRPGGRVPRRAQVTGRGARGRERPGPRSGPPGAVQVLASRLPSADPGAPLEAGDETVAGESVDIDTLAEPLQ